MPPKGYTTITVPSKLIAVIHRIIQDPDSPYATTSEFVKQALREKIEKTQALTHIANKSGHN